MKQRNLILIICLCCSFTVLAQNNVLDNLSEMDGVSAVYISKSMFNTIENMNMGGLDISKVTGKVEAMQILTGEKPKAVQTMKIQAEKLVKRQEYEMMMKVKDSGSKVTFYTQKQKDKIKELLMLIDEAPNEYTIIQIKGELSLKEIQEITNLK